VTGHAEAAVESFRSSSLRYERERSGSASFAARPRGARRRSRSAARRCEGGARSAGNRAAGTRVPDVRSSRLQRSTSRISESGAALQTRLRGRRLQNAAHSNSIGAPWPFGHAGAELPATLQLRCMCGGAFVS
jgi:hypothetical protein